VSNSRASKKGLNVAVQLKKAKEESAEMLAVMESIFFPLGALINQSADWTKNLFIFIDSSTASQLQQLQNAYEIFKQIKKNSNHSGNSLLENYKRSAREINISLEAVREQLSDMVGYRNSLLAENSLLRDKLKAERSRIKELQGKEELLKTRHKREKEQQTASRYEEEINYLKSRVMAMLSGDFSL
jgi:hypothetical protein